MTEEPGWFFITYLLLILIAAAILVSLITIVKYRNRIQQFRLCIFNILLLLGFYSILFYPLNKAKVHFTATNSFEIPVLFPVICVILIFHAISGISKDIILFRSYDRIS